MQTCLDGLKSFSLNLLDEFGPHSYTSDRDSFGASDDFVQVIFVLLSTPFLEDCHCCGVCPLSLR